MNKQSFADNTYSLAKALHNLNIGKEYLELIRIGTSGELKQLFWASHKQDRLCD